MQSPTIKPVVLTSRPQLKRKHGDIVDLTNDDDNVEGPHQPAQASDAAAISIEVSEHGIENGDAGSNHDDAHEEDSSDDDDEDEEEMFEDALDEIELNPYRPPDGEGLTESHIARLRAELRVLGADRFLYRYLTDKQTSMPPRLLGTAFGIDPELELNDTFHLRLLGQAILRAYNKRQKLPQYNTIDDAAELLKRSKNVMVITGAGISTSLGIPDFRSKNTGFYDRVKALGLAEGEEVFDIHEFDHDPTKFYSLAGDILPDLKRYSPTHAFIRLLQDEGRLQTNYTQNIDNLEQLAGIESARLIQCHGSFATATCRKCGHKVPGTDIFADIRAKRVARCKRCLLNPSTLRIPSAPHKKRKGSAKPKRNEWDDSDDSDGAYDIPQAGVYKPDITFFGEQLPDDFFKRFTDKDSKDVDLVLVMGTSLKVAPVSEMSRFLPAKVPHIYVSREPIEHIDFDIQLLGDCDHVVFELCRRAGWNLKHDMIPEGFRVKVKPVEESTYRWRITPRGQSGVLGATPTASSRAVTPMSRAGTPGSRASPSPAKSKTSVREASRSPRPPIVQPIDPNGLRPFYEKYLGKA